MCLYFFDVWPGCDHKDWIGSESCGVDLWTPGHRASYDYCEMSGYGCPSCRSDRGEIIKTRDVEYYPPIDLKVAVVGEGLGGRVVPDISIEPCQSLLPRPDEPMLRISFHRPSFRTQHGFGLGGRAHSTFHQPNFPKPQWVQQMQQAPKLQKKESYTQAQQPSEEEQLGSPSANSRAVKAPEQYYLYGGWMPSTVGNPHGVPVLFSRAFMPTREVALSPPPIPAAAPRRGSQQAGNSSPDPGYYHGYL